MIVFLNGRFVPEEQAVVSVFDRSFLYGDGLFETMLVRNRRPFRWDAHLQRLKAGAAFLNIPVPFSVAELHAFAAELIERNQLANGLLRLTLSRGAGVRGYSPRGADRPVVVMTAHPSEPMNGLVTWKLITSTFRLPAGDFIAQFKTCNKLAQVMARSEADAAGANEALLLNTDGAVVEGASSNLFWIEHGTLWTPPLAAGILAGVTRAVVFELARKLELRTEQGSITPLQLAATEGVFLSLSSFGIVAAASLDGTELKSSLIVSRLAEAYWDLVDAETD